MAANHILIVDDEDFLCVTIAELLREAQYNVSIVNDGSEVLPVIEKEKIDLVLLDLMMPIMGGMETLTVIKKHSPETRVIMLSGYDSEDRVEEAERLGSDGFINKPFGVETLIRHIKTVLASSSRAPFHEPDIE